MKGMIRVSLLKRKARGGKTYLSFSYKPAFKDPHTFEEISEEPLHVYIYTDPKNKVQSKYNEQILEMVEIKKAERLLDMSRNMLNIFDRNVLDEDFLEYFSKLAEERNVSWKRSELRFEEYIGGHCTFSDLNLKTCNGFREWLLHDARRLPDKCKQGKKAKQHLSQNTASKYFMIFKHVIRQAYKDRYIPDDIDARLKNIPTIENRREYLTREEILRLYDTPCRYDALKKASMFSIFTGLRISDIMQLKWEDITFSPDGRPCIRKIIEKTKQEKTICINEDALQFCGPRGEGYVFPNFHQSFTNAPLKHWLENAGITKHITFHCFRHSYASLLLAENVDLYTISQQLTHARLNTTQIYLHMYNTKAREAADCITLDKLKRKERQRKEDDPE